MLIVSLNVCRGSVVPDEVEIQPSQLAQIMAGGNFPDFVRMSLNCGYQRAIDRGLLGYYQSQSPIQARNEPPQITQTHVNERLNDIFHMFLKALGDNSRKNMDGAAGVPKKRADDESMVWLG